MNKVRSGMSIEQAVEDIISRGVSELTKNAFGDDAEDAKNLPWSREQAWKLMKELAKQEEVSALRGLHSLATNVFVQIPYHDVLMDFPFKGDEQPLREMERAELILISTQNGTCRCAIT
jgi:hypothetical protein